MALPNHRILTQLIAQLAAQSTRLPSEDLTIIALAADRVTWFTSDRFGDQLLGVFRDPLSDRDARDWYFLYQEGQLGVITVGPASFFQDRLCKLLDPALEGPAHVLACKTLSLYSRALSYLFDQGLRFQLVAPGWIQTFLADPLHDNDNDRIAKWTNTVYRGRSEHGQRLFSRGQLPLPAGITLTLESAFRSVSPTGAPVLLLKHEKGGERYFCRQQHRQLFRDQSELNWTEITAEEPVGTQRNCAYCGLAFKVGGHQVTQSEPAEPVKTESAAATASVLLLKHGETLFYFCRQEHRQLFRSQSPLSWAETTAEEPVGTSRTCAYCLGTFAVGGHQVTQAEPAEPTDATDVEAPTRLVLGLRVAAYWRPDVLESVHYQYFCSLGCRASTENRFRYDNAFRVTAMDIPMPPGKALRCSQCGGSFRAGESP